MTWESDLEIVVAKTGIERYRVLCSEYWANEAQRRAYRNLMIVKAQELTDAPDAPAAQAKIVMGCCGQILPG